MKYKYLIGNVSYSSLPKEEKEKQRELMTFIVKDQGLLLNDETLKIFLQRYKNIIDKLNFKHKKTSPWVIELFKPSDMSDMAASDYLHFKYGSQLIVGMSLPLHIIKGEFQPIKSNQNESRSY